MRLPLIRRWFPRADAIVAVSRGVAMDLAATAGLPPERITTIPNPTVTSDLADKARVPLDHPWFTGGGPPVVLGVGRLHEQKDFPTLLRAFGRVRKVREARLVILGEGSQRAKLESMVRRLEIGDDVALPGFVSNPFPYMAQASVFVLSSTWEGLPSVLIEAMACGCPVVSTDCPSGPVEILEGGAFGPLVPRGDESALAEAILSVLDAPPDRDPLRTRAMQFTAESAGDRYVELLYGEKQGSPTLRERAGPC